MTKELNFYNLTVKYDGDKLSQKELRKLKSFMWIGCIVITLFLSGSVALCCVTFSDPNSFQLVLGGLSMGVTVYGGAFGLDYLIHKIAPRHYELVTWLMRFQQHEIEAYWMNNRYGLCMFISGWHHKELDYVLKEDYNLIDSADKAYPIHMTIDLTQDIIEVTVKNK